MKRARITVHGIVRGVFLVDYKRYFTVQNYAQTISQKRNIYI